MGAYQMMAFFPGFKKDQLPNGLGWAIEILSLTTHSGSHLDALYHYHPTQDAGKPSLTIAEIPLTWCMGDGVLLDFRHKADGEAITALDVEQELHRIGYTLKPLDIVLVQTGADSAWGTPQYLIKDGGMTRESTLYLTERGGSRRRHRRLELGPTPALSRPGLYAKWGPQGNLGGPFCRDRHRLLPYGKDSKSICHRQPFRFYDLLLPHQDQKGLGGVVQACRYY
jgi:hypothetical protein